MNKNEDKSINIANIEAELAEIKIEAINNYKNLIILNKKLNSILQDEDLLKELNKHVSNYYNRITSKINEYEHSLVMHIVGI